MGWYYIFCILCEWNVKSQARSFWCAKCEKKKKKKDLSIPKLEALTLTTIYIYIYIYTNIYNIFILL